MMDRSIRSGLILALLGFCSVSGTLAAASSESRLNFYVARDGDDDWSGRLDHPNDGRTDGPLATLTAAMDKIRRIKAGRPLPENGVTIHVCGGDYFLTDTFSLTRADSGTEKAPIVYRACGDETVRLIGGREVKSFGPVTDKSILARIDQPLHNKILCADLKAQGITDYGKLVSRGAGRGGSAAMELFFQDKPMTPARWPDTDWVKIDAVPAGQNGGRFTYKEDRPDRWIGLDDAWLHGFWTHDWADSYEHIASIDPETKSIETHPPHGVYGYKSGQRYYALNILEELDRPGEYYIDRDKGILYFYPPAPIDNFRAFVSTLGTIIDMDDCEFITIQGFSIECTRATAVTIKGGRNNRIVACTIRNTGNKAVSVLGTNNGVIACDIYATADGGIDLSGGDLQKLIPAGNYTDNNHIHNYSRWCLTYRPAVKIGGVGQRVTHNLVHNAPHNAIQLGGNDHLIEFNEIHDVCTESDDVGAFYSGRSWVERGTVIRYNFFHHIHSAAEQYRHGSRVIYLDDAASGFTVYGNVFYKAGSLCAVNVGGGRDNIITNNIFIDCKNGVLIDARGLGWAKDFIAEGGGWRMYEKLAEVNYQKPPYRARYPKLATILDDNPHAPCGNVVTGNLAVRTPLLNLQDDHAELVTIENNFSTDKADFANEQNMNFRLKNDSSIYKRIADFEKIPFEEIGLYKDNYRKVLP